ncbi:MAG: gamma-glutamyl-gamma-aminobutyrate hydrolase family protein [Christensenella sp.]|nr:gamma-glutamyl-gamma-aminobutyrate hydrolase family protein [Christensenella sp.]
MEKPLIGIMPLWDEEKQSIWLLPGYLKEIEKCGGLPVILPLTTEDSMINQIARTFDGFLFTGGQDVLPALYGETPIEQCDDYAPERDKMEQKLFEKAVMELNKPAFGICRGIQLFNVLLGGTLYQDLPAQKGEEVRHYQGAPYDIPSHSVQIIPGSSLHQLLKKEKILVNSCHHQAIKQLAPGIKAEAVSDDGVVEAIMMSDRSYLRAVQWHPECMPHDETAQKLFQVFVEACGIFGNKLL